MYFFFFHFSILVVYTFQDAVHRVLYVTDIIIQCIKYKTHKLKLLKSTKLNSKSETNKIKSVPFTNMDAALFTNSMDTVLGSLAVKKWGKLEQKSKK